MSEAPAERAGQPAEPPGRLRWLVRLAVLAAAVLALWPVLRGSQSPLVVPALSPFVAMASLIAARAVSVAAVLGLAVAVVAVFRRRWLCRWVCPTGTCAEVASRAGARMGLRGPRLPPIGQWIALATLGGAALGLPVLLWLDPLAIFSAVFAAQGPASGAAAWAGAAALTVVLLVSLVLPGLWCARLCPLGGTQELLYAVRRIVWRRDASPEDRSRSKQGLRLARRTALAAAVGVAWAAVVRRGWAEAARPLRPPGAVAEEIFVGLCVRCGNCVRACPTKIVAPDTSASGLAGLLTPTLAFHDDYCLETCALCTQVCPSGALARLLPEEKLRAPIGLAEVNMDICLLGEDRECAICRSRCPYEAITYAFSEETYAVTPRIDAARCPGCGACEAACPTRPTKAIVVRPLNRT
ncbi:MAG: 4Fe-4S dicluster domain-containing protein [Thermoguttaceae bacterium]|nr:4Fe-4S dicluster domain-containing protein [Thermoguttaceae bacterium]